ncbi:MAG: prepilin-type N-terminal cleavage/methylation domain-containing protein [Sedimentisphaerales bacterium]|nr:prepilin-type N-terminal cleavage/methylation domain-containing protein [Sedimentisphaerales bacterium]
MKLNRQNNSAFTLVELVLATVIGALVVIVALSAYHNVSRNRTEADYYSRLMAQGRYALNRIRDDLANFYPCNTDNGISFVGIPSVDTTAAENHSDQLRFYVAAEPKFEKNLDHFTEVPLEQTAGDLYEIEYQLKTNENDHTKALYRRIGTLIYPQQGNPAGRSMRIAQNIKSLQFEYYEKSSDLWQSQWHHNRAGPDLVRVSMLLSDDSQNKFKPVMISQEIALPRRTDDWSNNDNQQTDTTELSAP